MCFCSMISVLGSIQDGLGAAFACRGCPDAEFALGLLSWALRRRAAEKHAAHILQLICGLQSCYKTAVMLLCSSLLV